MPNDISDGVGGGVGFPVYFDEGRTSDFPDVGNREFPNVGDAC